MTNNIIMKIKFLYTLTFCLFLFAVSSNAQNSLAVTVFHDLDGNGLEDGGEPTIAGVLTTELRLWQDIDNNGAINFGDIEFMHDNGIGGVYTFGTGNVLPDDNYILEYVEVGGPGAYYVTKLVNGVGTMDMDNDLDPMSNTAGFPLSGDTPEMLIDLGLVIAGDIGGYAWEDTNGDGFQDGGEPAIMTMDVMATLLDATTMTPVVNDIDFVPLTNPATTDGTGNYSFDNLPPGQYIIEFTVPNPSPDPWYPTTSAVETDATDVTNDSDAENDSTSPNYLQTHTIILLSDETDEEEKIDVGFFQAAIIGDWVWEDLNGDGIQDAGEPGLNGVTVTLLDDLGAPVIGADGLVIADQITMNVLGTDGIYQFMLVPPGDYQVQFNLPAPIGGVDWYPTEFDPAHTDANDPDIDSDANNDPADVTNYLKSHVITIESGETDEELRIDAGFWLPVTVGNHVFCDENGNGIDDDGVGGVDGVDVRIIDSGTGLTAQDADGMDLTTTTAGGGDYMFDLVPPGFYIIEFSFTGATPDPPFVFTLQNDPDGLGDDFSDSDVDPDPFGGAFGQTEEIEIVSQDTEEEMKWDAGVYQVINIFGTLWLEDDMNNMYDGEMGPSGVLIELIDATNLAKIDEVLTNQGEYEFIGLAPGEYYIQYDITGTTIESASPCPGSNDANDMVDNDDNAPDTGTFIQTTTFTALSNCDPNDPPEITYIDFCYFFDCNEENDLAATACSEIQPMDIICEIATLGTFCNIMPTNNSPGTQPNPLCSDGGAPHNISWFAFVAYGGTYSVTVTPTGCVGSTTGQEGVQIGLYTDCTFTESVYCDPTCNENPVTFNSDVLEEGQTYYFFIDGCSSSVCSYEVEIDGNPIPPNLAPDDMCINDNGTFICEDATYCPDADIIFEATGIDLTVDFTWSITTQAGGPYDGDANPMTEDQMLPISFANEGVYEVCLEVIDNGCQIWNTGICRTITIMGIDDEVFDDQIICEEDLASFDLGVFDPDDPNTDGTMGWQATGTVITFGTVMGTVTTDDGCMYDQQFELMMHPESDQGLLDSTICRDELPFMIDQLELTELSFSGTLIFDLQDYLMLNVSDQNGCDSVIDINVELLDIIGGGFEDPVCVTEGIIMTFNYLDDISTAPEFITFEWFDPSMNPLPDTWEPADPLNNIAPASIGSGTYTLIATIDKNGKQCTFTYTIDIDFDMFLPQAPEIMAPGFEVCEADSIVTYTAINFGTATIFDWSYPSDVAEASTSGANGEVITINWSGSAGGTVTLITNNGCGDSEAVDIMITVIPQQTPVFDFTTEVCVDSCIIVEFVGDATDLTFTWDFDGGTENNGTGGVGPGPHCISWSDAGDKTITLSYTDLAGCESTATTETVTVIAPITPPIINCNPNTGEVSFTWDDVPGNLGYEVEVTSTSIVTGMLHEGVLSGTTFTVDGLNEGEIVTIIVTIFTDDACQMITAVSPGCAAQDCIAPSITLESDITSFCLDENSGTATITATITSGENGTGVFSGPGIVDPDNGIFDPDSANIGINTITYVFMTDDMPIPCIGNQTIQIEVLETPVASFTPDVDTICITDQFNLTYDGTSGAAVYTWDYGVGGTGTGGPMPTVSYDSPGDKTIRLTVEKDGCESESVTYNVVVQPELPPIDIICSLQEIDQVEFSWNSIPGATGYEVTVNSEPPFTTTQTSHSEMNLNPNDIVTITVTVLTDSRCPGSTDTQECTAQACPTFEITFDQDVIAECVDGTNAPIPLIATATGGDGDGDYTWSGQNVSGNEFDPNGLPEGSYTILVTYEEDSCENSDSMRIEITTTPTAAFSVDNTTICVGSTVNITYEGSQLADQVITWSPAGQVTAGTNPNEYVATFNSEGVFDIQLDVENGNCTTMPATAQITVEPELVFGDIDCTPSLDQVAFSWAPVDCVTEYEVFIGGVSQGIQTDTEYIESGLDVGTEVDIEVIAISDCACGNVTMTAVCETTECTTIQLSLFTMDGITEFCNTEDLAPIEIMAQADGTLGNGTWVWSGPGIDQDGVFDPAVAGIGTHTIYYDFLESAGCPHIDSIMITINELPEVTHQFDEILCYDQTNTNLEVIPSGGTGNYTITLNGNDADLMNDVTAGEYTIVVMDENQCSATSSVTITIPNEPTPSISGSAELILGDSSTYSIQSLLVDSMAIDSIVWSANGQEICNDPGCFSIGTQSPTETTVYEVTVHYNDGCSVTTALTVEVLVIEPPSRVEIPNIISPNSDGENDEWQIVSNDEEVIVNSIRIFDRWGNMVWGFSGPFPAKDNNVIWDGTFNGKVLQPGVYVYFVDFIQEGRNKIRSGDVTIIN